MRRKILLPLVLLCCFVLQARLASATHFVGSDFSYRAVPGQPDTYVLTVNFYRDCGGILAPVMVPVKCTPISCPGAVAQTVNLPLVDSMEVSEVCAGLPTECSNPPGTVQGIQKYVYSDTVTLSAGNCYWNLSFENCCRNAGIINLVNSVDKGYYVNAWLNNFSGINNNSPTYAASPAPYFCVNDTVTYTPQVSDIDGDSLSFSFFYPFTKTGYVSPMQVQHAPGYTFDQPFGAGAPVTLDPQTGILTFIPNTIGAFVIVLKVDEWRTIGGTVVKVGESRRDIQVQVMACTTPCPMAGNTIGVNGSSQSGSQEVQTLANQLVEVTIPATSTNPNVTLTMTSNCQAEIPGSSFYVTGAGSNVTGIFNWTPEAAHTRDAPYFFTFLVSDNACPIPNERYGVVKVKVLENPNGITAPSVSQTILFPNLLTGGQVFALPPDLGPLNLQVFDATGKVVFQKQSYNNSWSGNGVPSGMYFFRIVLQESGQVFGGKVVLQK